MPMISALDVRDVTVSYGRQAAVDRVTFNVNEGEILGIVGPNGAGKTSLFRAILGLEPYNGTIRLFEYDHAKVGALIPLIGYVPQKISFEPNFPASVYDVVSMGAIPNKKVVAGAKIIQQCGCCWNRIYANMSKIEDRIMAALDTVGLIHLKDRRIGELSGGEMQRVFIAKCLVKDPLMLILDEPVASVDADAQAKFYSVIKRINSENGITIIWSSHDLDAIKKHADSVACMNRKLFFHGEKTEFFSDKDAVKAYAESAMQMHMRHH